MAKRKNVVPDVDQTLRNMRDELSRLLVEESGGEWEVQAGETPAMFAHRYFQSVEADCSTSLSPEGEGPAPNDWRPPAGERIPVLAYALKQLFVRQRISGMESLLHAEIRAWDAAFVALDKAIRFSEKASEDEGYAASVSEGRSPFFLPQASAFRGALEQQFPCKEREEASKRDESPSEYSQKIVSAAERDLEPEFGDAAIARLVIDGQSTSGRRREDRVRKRREEHAEKVNSKTPQTTREWTVMLLTKSHERPPHTTRSRPPT